jgi:hypothetical protein
MAGGRPRTVSLPPEDMIKLGEEMLKWIEKNDPIHLCQFYSLEKMFTYKQWDAMTQKPEFVPYYEKALQIIGLKYLRKDNEIEPSIKQRFLRVYFKDVKHAENEKIAYEASAGMASTTTAPNQDTIDIQQENMRLKARIAELEAANGNQSKAG